MIVNNEAYLNKLIASIGDGKIKVITGVEFSGKTTLLFNDFYNYLKSISTKEKRIIKLNLKETKRLRQGNKLNSYLLKKITDDKKHFVLIDEAQYCDHIEDVLKEKIKPHIEVFLIISAIERNKDGNKLIYDDNINEINVLPRYFDELANDAIENNVSEAFLHYTVYGGFPSVISKDTIIDKKLALKEIEDSFVLENLVDRYKIRHPDLLAAAYCFLCNNIGKSLTSKKIADTLRELGFSKLTTDTVTKYLNFFIDTRIFHKVYRFDIKKNEHLKTLNKYYICDPGLISINLNKWNHDSKEIYENIVYLELLRKGYSVVSGKNGNKAIDFIAKSPTEDELFYIQVVYNIGNELEKQTAIDSFKNIDDGYKKVLISVSDDKFAALSKGYKKLNIVDFINGTITLESL